MTAEQFEAFWESTYPLSVPLSYLLRIDYASRWFRIHSLPESQRYPHDDADWCILLNRHNALFSDLLGNASRLLLVTGQYDFDSAESGTSEFLPDASISSLIFTRLEPIKIGERELAEHEAEETYKPVVAELDWQSGDYDGILKDAALDRIRLLFISVDAKCIIAPYDGGVDIILKDTATRDYYKLKYERWLSFTEDGL